MAKFLVLNQMFQPMNPYQFNFFSTAQEEDVDGPSPPKNPFQLVLFGDEPMAKKFAEFLAKTQINQVFHLVELKGQVKSDPPVFWSP